MSDREPREILITGASSGIGYELARQLAAPGTRLWLVARRQDLLEKLASEVRDKGARAEVLAMDLSELESGAEFLERFTAEVKIDELYLAAAVSIFGEVKDIQPADWDLIYRTDLLAHAQWLHAFYASMAASGGGRIVMVSSLAGYAGYPTSVPYATMKAGLLGLYRTLRYEAPRHGIHIHLVSPGYVRTGIYQSAVYRRSTCESTLRQIDESGFKMMEADAAAAAILKGIAAGRGEIVFPGYARLLSWIAPRFPAVVRAVHASMVKRFRELAA